VTTETEFVKGLIVKAPNDKAPEYVKARLSFKREEMIAWLQSRDGEWVNADVKVAQSGKWYAAVDNWKPNEGRGGGPVQQRGEQPQRGTARQETLANDFDDADIPFATNRGTF
jgi:hypothetical protein